MKILFLIIGFLTIGEDICMVSKRDRIERNEMCEY